MNLLVLWDPLNPMVPVGPVISALPRFSKVFDLKFGSSIHRTSPNFGFDIRPIVDRLHPDGILWIEGGPLPRDLSDCNCRKACWLINSNLEPTLIADMTPLFDVRLTATRFACDQNFRWLPLAASGGIQPIVSATQVITSDPMPASHAMVAATIRGAVTAHSNSGLSITVCPGQNRQPSGGVFDRMASGTITIVDPESDIRDIGHPGDHLLVYPSIQELPKFLQTLNEDPESGRRISARGPDIVKHLHTPDLRAKQLFESIWPTSTVLGGNQHSPQISVLTSCYKYLKRFRCYLASLAKQKLPAGSLEIVVADPGSPDGLYEYLREFANKNAHLRIVHVPIDGMYNRNRGLCINRAFKSSSGHIIVATDGDIIFPQDLVGHLAEQSRAHADLVFGVRRSFLDRSATTEILEGRRDPLGDFLELSKVHSDGEPNGREGVLGYCQVLRRAAFERAGYPEEFDMINQSDIVFLERLQKYAQVTPCFLENKTVLHLWHPRDWSGTKDLL
jgi:hypothetical protein